MSSIDKKREEEKKIADVSKIYTDRPRWCLSDLKWLANWEETWIRSWSICWAHDECIKKNVFLLNVVVCFLRLNENDIVSVLCLSLRSHLFPFAWAITVVRWVLCRERRTGRRNFFPRRSWRTRHKATKKKKRTRKEKKKIPWSLVVVVAVDIVVIFALAILFFSKSALVKQNNKKKIDETHYFDL